MHYNEDILALKNRVHWESNGFEAECKDLRSWLSEFQLVDVTRKVGSLVVLT